MFPDADGLPVVGEERNQLGVRPTEKGMSVFLEPGRIPPPIRPKDVLDANGECGLNGETVLYSMSEDDLGERQLRLGKVARSTHAPIEPEPYLWTRSMYIFQCSSQDDFIQRAGDRPVRVVRTPRVVPTVVSNAVVMQPSVVLDYRVDVLDETQGEIAYVFQETVPAGDQGWVDFDGTLLARLKQRKSPLAVVQRSGSI